MNHEELEILRSMYPELNYDEELKSGTLPFDILPYSDVTVKCSDYSITMNKFSGNMLIINSDSYEIVSEWMRDVDIVKLKENIELDEHMPYVMLVDNLINSDVLFENNEYCTDITHFNIIKRLNESQKVGDFNKLNFECSICLETKKGSSMTQLPCLQHYLCHACLVDYYTNVINEANINAVRCPECLFEEIKIDDHMRYVDLKRTIFTPSIPFEFFTDKLTPEVCLKYRTHFKEQAVTKMLQYSPYSCTNCRRCEKFVVRDNLDDDMLTCEECHFVFCFQCLHSWHGYNNPCGKRCGLDPAFLEEYLSDTVTEARKKELEFKFGKKQLRIECDAYIADKLLDEAIDDPNSDLQRCPGCRTVVQRSEGCNKMKCSVCSIMFCYICAQLLDPEDPYEHFREMYSNCYGKLFEGMEGVEDALF